MSQKFSIQIKFNGRNSEVLKTFITIVKNCLIELAGEGKRNCL